MILKNRTAGYLVLAIVFALISVIAFAIPTEKTSTFWIAYAFTAIAFIAQLIIWKAAWGKASTLKSKFLGWPIIRVGYYYLVIQIIVFAVFVGVAGVCPSFVAVIVCCLVLAIAAICLITTEVAREEIARVEQKVQRKVFAQKTLQVEIETLAKSEKDAEVQAALTRLARKVRFSDPMSSETLVNLENAIMDKVNAIKTSSDKLSLINEIDALLDERNAKCKIAK